MDQAVSLFEKVSFDYDEEEPRMFSRFGEALVLSTAPGPNERILDLACGKGAISIPAALLNSKGETVALDASPGMLEGLRLKAISAGISLTTLLADVHQLPYPDHSFDRCYIGFALFYFHDPNQVLREVFRVLRPGGRLHLSTWQESVGMVGRALSRLLGARCQAAPPLMRYRYANINNCRKLLIQNNFCLVKNEKITLNLRYPDPESWWQGLWSHGARSDLETLEPALLLQLQEILMLQIKKDFWVGNEVVIPIGAIFSSGERR